jgi:hypothetical protein
MCEVGFLSLCLTKHIAVKRCPFLKHHAMRCIIQKSGKQLSGFLGSLVVKGVLFAYLCNLIYMHAAYDLISLLSLAEIPLSYLHPLPVLAFNMAIFRWIHVICNQLHVAVVTVAYFMLV